jgi:hypothetical protein
LPSCHAAPCRLDDQVLFGPAKVWNHAPAADHDWLVDVRAFEAAVEQEIENHVLEHASRRGRTANDRESQPA